MPTKLQLLCLHGNRGITYFVADRLPILYEAGDFLIGLITLLVNVACNTFKVNSLGNVF